MCSQYTKAYLIFAFRNALLNVRLLNQYIKIAFLFTNNYTFLAPAYGCQKLRHRFNMCTAKVFGL